MMEDGRGRKAEIGGQKTGARCQRFRVAFSSLAAFILTSKTWSSGSGLFTLRNLNCGIYFLRCEKIPLKSGNFLPHSG
jgi:hypothetical protein